jgi:hypothetical protein
LIEIQSKNNSLASQRKTTANSQIETISTKK